MKLTKKYSKEKRAPPQNQTLLKRDGYTLADVGAALGKTRQTVHKTVFGKCNSEEILNCIASMGIPERVLGAPRK